MTGPDPQHLRVCFVENEDSFSWNVVEALPVPRENVTWHRGSALGGKLPADVGDVVLLGPGPLDPFRAGLVPITREAIRRGLPLLGICLGHQAIGLAYGAALRRTEPHHGKRATIDLLPSRWMPGETGLREVMRYHSLALDDVPPTLSVLARTSDGVVMAVEDPLKPVLGLQFHPDSFATEGGPAMLRAFFGAIAGRHP